MSYCRKCGTKLGDTARFCTVCGTPVPPVSPHPQQAAPAQTARQVRRAGFPLAAIAIIIVVVLVFAALIVVFLPFQPVNFSQSNEASAPNINTLRLVVSADVANVNVILRDLPGNQRAATNISATGWRGIFSDDQPLALAFNKQTSGLTLTYLVNVSKSGGWSVFNMLDVSCDVYVDPSVNLDITVHTNTGSVVMNGDRETTFRRVTLQSGTGSISANLTDKTVVSGDVVLDVQTGSVTLAWSNVRVPRNIELRLVAATGSATVNVTQTRQMQGNVTLNTETSTGSVTLNMDIQNDVAARISATSSFGGIDVQQNGFSGNETRLQSGNYPTVSNFDVTLTTSTGGININANYELGGTRS